MRKQTAFLNGLLVPFALLCFCPVFSQNTGAENSIIFSGKITHLKSDERGQKLVNLKFPKGSSIAPKTIALNKEGIFLDTIVGPEGQYTILDGNFPYNLYFKPGGSYAIEYEAKTMLLTEVRLAGDDTSINRYFIDKQSEKTFFDPSEEKTEQEYRAVLGTWRERELKRISQFPLPVRMAERERKAVTYEYLFNLFLFIRFSEMREASFSPSTTSLRELEIKFDNEEDYKQYSDYSSLVYEYYLKKLDDINVARLKKDSTFSLRQNHIKLLAEIVANKYIRNSIIGSKVIYDLKEVDDIEAYYKDFLKYYDGNDEKIKEEALDAYLRLTKLKRGTLSPQFSDYINYRGGKNSLKDYLGSFVFIDLWATWCGNCWNEFPYIRKMEEKYKGVNIVFLSISLDEDKEEWANTIEKQRLPGIQLKATKTDDSFFKEYAVYGIPRYILLDKRGKIISYSTPRPSDEEAIEVLFKEAGL